MIKNIKENKMANRLSIYENTEYEKKLIAIYDRCLDSWPLDHKSLFLETSYGKVHVIASGPENAPRFFHFMLLRWLLGRGFLI